MRKDLKIMLIDLNLDKNDISRIILSYKPNYIFLNLKLKLDLNNYEKYLEFNTSIILKNKKNENYQIYNELVLLLGTSGSTGSKKIC